MGSKVCRRKVIAKFEILYPAFFSRNWGNLWENLVKKAYPRFEHETARMLRIANHSTPSLDGNRYLLLNDDRSNKIITVEIKTVKTTKFSLEF
jgi:hypothetical protein